MTNDGTSTTEQGGARERWVRLVGDEGDGSIDGFELFSARRALKLLKGKRGRERLLELLQDEIASGDAFLREHLAHSAGEQATGTTILRARGISAAQFTGWLSHAFAREDVMLAGHPEHYSIHNQSGGHVNIVETLGDRVCSFFIREWDESAVAEQELPSATEEAPAARRSRLALGDGTIVGSITNSFHDEPDGFTAQLSVTLPATCATEVIEQHLEHFAVEFRSWILAALTRPRGNWRLPPNHSMPGVLKNAIDHIYREWNNKAAGIVSYGGLAGRAPVSAREMSRHLWWSPDQ